MMTPTRARVLWYAPFLAAAVAQGANAVMQVLMGDLLHGATAAFLALFLAIWPIRRRAEYRQGWRSGFLEGLCVPGEIYHGTIPDAVVRHTATGTPTPDPWEPQPYLELDTNDDTKE